MPNLLDSPQSYTTYDTGHIAESVGLSIDQLESVIAQPRRLYLHPRHQSARAIIVCGMGGSNLGSEVLRNVFQNDIKVPLLLHRDYGLPSFVGRDTLVIGASYSGNTEETLSSLAEARRRNCPIIGIATGGAIAAFCERHRYPFFHIDGGLNPSDQPRLGLGYAMGALLTVLRHGGYLRTPSRSLLAPLAAIRLIKRNLLPTVPLKRNRAKQLAMTMNNYLPMIVAAEHLSGTAHIFANMVNENAKMFCASFSLPEINHHLIEGLSYPRRSVRQLQFIFIESKNYQKRIQRRAELTKQIMRKAGAAVTSIELAATSRFGEALEVVQLAGYATFYLALLNRVNPALIPWVNYLKKHLAKK